MQALKTIQLTKRVHIILNAIHDYECSEFHITPVLTYAWPPKNEKENFPTISSAFMVAFEWGLWAVCIGFAFTKRGGGF